MEEGTEQPHDHAYVYALTDEAAYLQTDDDEKPAIIAEPLPDPASFKCLFCRKSYQQVAQLFSGQYPVRDPNTLAVIAQVLICNECVARFAETLARETPGTSP
jgi:hypothetical protein